MDTINFERVKIVQRDKILNRISRLLVKQCNYDLIAQLCKRDKVTPEELFHYMQTRGFIK